MSLETNQTWVSVRLNEDAVFSYPANDLYWSSSLTGGVYEPDVDMVLRRSAERPYAMLDAGANYGFWSILASSTPYGGHSVVAIEPSKLNFSCLLHNAEINGSRFQTLRRAVLDETGKRVMLYGRNHYGLSLRKDWHPADVDQFEEVETITVDEVAHRFLPNRVHPPIVKFDIEGSESVAFKGALNLIDEGALIIYEDHGKERTHSVSCLALSIGYLTVWELCTGEYPKRVTTIQQVEEIKISPIRGYNFFAYHHSSPWRSLFEKW